MQNANQSLRERMLRLKHKYPQKLYRAIDLASDLIGISSSSGMPSASRGLLSLPVGSDAVNFYGLRTIGFLPEIDLEHMLDGILGFCVQGDETSSSNYKYRSVATDIISRRRSRNHTQDMIRLLESIDQFDVIMDCEGSSKKVTDYETDRKRFQDFFLSMNDPSLNNQLLRLIQSPEKFIRLYVAELIGSIGLQEAIPQLVELLNDNNPKNIFESYSPRHAAVLALAKLGCQDVGEVAIELLKSEDLTDQETGAKALVEFIYEPARKELVRKFTTTKAYRLLEDCTRALSKMQCRDEVARELLIYLDNIQHRSSIISSLAYLDCPWVGKQLVPLLDDEDPHLVGTVAETLGILQYEEAAPALLKTLKRIYEGQQPHTYIEKRQDEIKHGVVTDIITFSGGAQGKHYAVDHLIEALGRLRYKPAAQYLVRMMEESPHDIDNTIPDALTLINDTSIVGSVEEVLERGSGWVRLHAIDVLTGLGVRESKDKIVLYIDRSAEYKADEYNVQLSAVKYVASIGLREFAPQLVEIERQGRGCPAILDAIDTFDYREASDIFVNEMRTGGHLIDKVRAAELLSNMIGREFRDYTLSLGEKI